MASQTGLPNLARVLYAGLQVGLVTLAVWVLVRDRRAGGPYPVPAALPPSLPPAAAPAPPRPTPPRGDPHLLVDLATADRLMEERQWDKARELYERLATMSARGVRLTALYRSALCLEALGDWPGADRRYGEVAGLTQDATDQYVLVVSQARTWFRMGRVVEAARGAAKVLLETEAVLEKHPALAEARYILALSATQPDATDLNTSTPGARLFPLPSPVLPSYEWEPLYARDWIKPVPGPAEATWTLPAEDYLRVQRLGARVADVKISACFSNIDFHAALERMAAEAGLKLQLSPGAAQVSRQEHLRLFVADLMLSHVLTYACTPLDLAWTIQEETVSLQSLGELQEATRRSWKRGIGERLLREAVAWLPEHPAKETAAVHVGLLSYASRDYEQATAHLEEALSHEAAPAAAIAAGYNAALAYLVRKQPGKALEKLYYVVDRAPAHPMSSWAYRLAGQIHMHEAQWHNAVAELRRAVNTSSRPEDKAAALLWLAMAHLYADHPRAALRLLEKEAKDLKWGAYHPWYQFLTALAKCRLEGKEHAEAGKVLLEQSLQLPGSGPLGILGIYLQGHAWQELGLVDLMADLYEKVLPEAPASKIVQQIHEDLAAYYESQGDYQRAIQHLHAYRGATASGDLTRMRLRHASLLLEAGDYGGAILATREILESKPTPDEVAAALKIMGRAYQLQGDQLRAAHCFAGRLPLE